MRNVRAKSKLAEIQRSGRVPRGIFIASLDPAVTVIVGRVGYDFAIIDGEHGRFSLADIDSHVRACDQTGLIPIVRVLENRPTLIQSVLDAGAQGIMVPHLGSGEEAQRAVDSARYGPEGRRSMCASCYAGGYEFDGWSHWSDHAAQSNANVMIIPIIESAAGVENIDDIVAVDGIDFVMFGAADLAGDMGIDVNTEFGAIEAAWQKVQIAVRSAGKGLINMAGGIAGLSSGADLLIDLPDLMILHDVLRARMQEHSVSSAS